MAYSQWPLPAESLNDAEMRYSAYERELLGIVWALAQWKHYCRGPHSVIIQTDHAPLRHLPNQASVNARIWKWINVMQGYNLEIRHIPGKRNPADTLSRQDKKDALGGKQRYMMPTQTWSESCVSPQMQMIVPSRKL